MEDRCFVKKLSKKERDAMSQNRHVKCVLSICLTLFFVVACSFCSSGPKTTSVTIGTGELMGRYHPTGGEIAEFVNKKQKIYGFRCNIKSTLGSVYNINAIMAGDIEFGIVQSDRQYEAFNGLAEWKDKGPQKDLRSVFSLYTESVTLVATDASGIKTIRDLKGKRVNIGNTDSGGRQNAIDALSAAGIDWRTEIIVKGGKAADGPMLILSGEIDAFFHTVGHPSTIITFATVGVRRVRFIPIDNTERLLSKYPYYIKSLIPIKLYPGAVNVEDVETFGVKASFVTSAKTPDGVVYAITKEVFENLESFKKLHPTYNMLTKDSMRKDGLTAPIHPGALKYYQEVGIQPQMK
jgi:TRAP transporter TAXI family solute receptor